MSVDALARYAETLGNAENKASWVTDQAVTASGSRTACRRAALLGIRGPGRIRRGYQGVRSSEEEFGVKGSYEAID